MKKSSWFRSKEEQCVDPKSRHKTTKFNSTKQPLKELRTLDEEALRKLYPDKNLTVEDKVCSNCYTIIENEINDLSSRSTQSSENQISNSAEEQISSQVSSGESYEGLSSAVLRNLNETTKNLRLNVSPIKTIGYVHEDSRVRYAIRKRKQLNDAFDSKFSSKVMKLFDIAETSKSVEQSKFVILDKYL